MRLIQSDSYNRDVEKRLNKFSDAVTPEQIDEIDVADAIGNFDATAFANPNTYVWVRGSVNGFEVSKIKALVNHRKFKAQEVLDLEIRMPLVIIKNEPITVTGGQVGGEDGEVNFEYDASNETTWKLTIKIPDGWDGRNCFIKMPWAENSDKIKGYGPAMALHKAANTLKDALIGFTVLKDEKLITIKYRIPSSAYKSGAFLPSWGDTLNLKMWRPKNVSRR